MGKEAKARIRINEHLQRSGWRFFDDENGPANIFLETHIKLKKKTLEDLGADFEKTANGFVDYLMLDQRSFPIAILEAKSENFDPLVLSLSLFRKLNVVVMEVHLIQSTTLKLKR